MADTKISALTAATALAGTETLPVVQGGVTVKATPAQIKTYVETGGTITASDPVLDLTQTWNNGAVTFTGWKLNVTDTASASGSKIINAQVGGADRFTVFKSTGAASYNTYTDSSNYERLNLNPSAATNWMRVGPASAGSGSVNISMSLGPIGTGAISAHVPDSTAAGGNTRGANAVDWQSSRSGAALVATGQESVISGGYNNQASGLRSTIVGGSTNTATNAYASVGGGDSNQATGVRSTIAGGGSNISSGTGSWIPGGSAATTRGITYAGAYAGFYRAAAGDRQTMLLPIATAARTDATPTVMTSDAGAAGATNQMILPNASAYMCTVEVVAYDPGGVLAGAWEYKTLIKRGANAAATALVGTPTLIWSENGLSGGSPGVALTADTTNGGLAVTFTGIAATTLYVSGHITCRQVG